MAAQGPIRIIPQQTLDSLTQTRTIPDGAKMHFEAPEIDLGTLNEEDEPRSAEFRWRNDFDRPVVVLRVTTGCGCTRPNFEKRPVLPGEEAAIRITYHPKGHPGTILRRCMIYTQLSTSTPTAVVTLLGYVEPSARPTHNYPHALGPLLLKQRTATFRADGKPQTVRIACMNGSDSPLRPQVVPTIPTGFSVTCEPESLPPGAEGDLVLRYDPVQSASTGPKPWSVMFANLGIAPRETSVRIEIETEE